CANGGYNGRMLDSW
nr:immunoglobulin heavy chain junction region [Macaca mulatta]MOV40036.1 immunoglobulin heavy chain junction region [Macaca mulatta]MOV40936.1 immunoglobulin heavy chain junction region [Macaca mulatta]MOV42124.1 immunoglobulin heavy chain junction region [Macaca mulatta]MOV42637.1 immunoglobulin heavy chain junction region [Macaca mulatta]